MHLEGHAELETSPCSAVPTGHPSTRLANQSLFALIILECHVELRDLHLAHHRVGPSVCAAGAPLVVRQVVAASAKLGCPSCGGQRAAGRALSVAGGRFIHGFSRGRKTRMLGVLQRWSHSSSA